MRYRIAILAGIVALLPVLAWANPVPEVRPFVGAFMPAGDMRDELKAAPVVGAQLALETTDYLHVLGTFAFAGPNMKGWVGPDHMHIFQSDLGGELFRSFTTASEWEIRPFVGLGAGVRTYDLTKSAGMKSYVSGYGSVGTELQLAKVAIRLEGRDYVSRFRGLTGTGDTETRNDFMVTGGFAFHLW